MHGIIMVFFFLVPSIPATLANFLIPIMIGAKDLAFPRINLLSWYIYVAGALFTLYAVVRGGVDTGWTFYTPYSSTYSNSYVLAAAFGIFIAGFSSILTGLNFIVTVHKMRAPGMTWSRLPLFVWSNYATGLIQVLGTPVLAITLLLLAFERIAHVGIFDPNIGGDPDPVPASVLVLFASGRLHHDSAGYGRHQRDRFLLLAQAHLRLQLRRVLEHGHRGPQLRCLGSSHVHHRREHVYGVSFSLLSMMVAVPSAIKVFNWTATMYKGSVSFRHPDAVCIRLHRTVHDRRPDRACFSRRSQPTSRRTAPTSLWRTSTTSWWAAW